MGADEEERTEADLIADPDTVTPFRVLVRAPRASLKGESTPLRFTLEEEESSKRTVYDTVFRGPK